MLSVPVLEHIGGHAMAFFELAALHLEREAATGGQEQPDMAEASLAIDAMAALVEGLGDEAGPLPGAAGGRPRTSSGRRFVQRS